MPIQPVRSVSMILFDGFELLDVFGPLEVFGLLPQRCAVTLIGPSAGPVASAQGTAVIADVGYAAAPRPDIVMVPGGHGTRLLADDGPWLAWLCDWAAKAELVTSVCTGSALLAAAGLLTGYRATSNRRAFDWVTTHGHDVEWVCDARWVEDRDRWTSAGISAGIDMTLALAASLWGADVAQAAARRMEYNWTDITPTEQSN